MANTDAPESSFSWLEIDDSNKTTRGLIAVEKADNTTGAIAYWQLCGDVQLSALREAWLAEQLDEALLPKPNSDDAALTRAAKSLQEQRVLVRKDPRGGWAVVREQANTAAGLSYEIPGRVTFKDGVVTFADGVDSASYEARVRAEYERARSTLSTVDVSQWLVGLMTKLGGVPLRDRGGIYFVPRKAIETYQKARRAVEAKSSHALHEIPAMRSTETVRAIVDAVTHEARTSCEMIEGELNAATGLGSRAAKNRIDEVDAMLSKLLDYEALVGQKIEGTDKRLRELRAKLEKIQTRGSQLEVD